MEAAKELTKEGIDVEVLDLRTVKPVDKGRLLASVQKTGRLVVADVGWKSFGAAAEISSIVFEEAFEHMKKPVVRVTLPDIPAPASRTLETVYYPTAKTIVQAVRKLI